MAPKSFIWDLFMNSFYDEFQKIIPSKISPNSITLFGGLCACASLWAMERNNLWLHSFLIFVYWSCDCVDGKHARATGQCSKIGAFLDHSIDGMFGNTSMCMVWILCLTNDLYCKNLAVLCFQYVFLCSHTVDLLVNHFDWGFVYGVTVVEIYAASQVMGILHAATGWKTDITEGLTAFELWVPYLFGVYSLYSVYCRSKNITPKRILASMGTFALFGWHFSQFDTMGTFNTYNHPIFFVALIYTLTWTSYLNH